MQLATPVDQSYQQYYRYRNIHEGTVPSCIPIYIRNLKKCFLPTATINCSASSNQTAPQPAVEPQTTSTCCAVTVTKEHLLCSRYDCSCREIRFRLISPIPSLMNRRGNNLHTVDVNTTWYVHREGVQPQHQGNNYHVDMSMLVPFSL